MRSKRSFFDARIYKNTLSRLWPGGLVCAAAWVYVLIRDVGRQNLIYVSPEDRTVLLLRQILTSGSFVCLSASVVTAAAVYFWLFSTRSTAFYTSLPLRRETVFLSDMAAGFTVLEAAAVLGLLFTALLGGLGGAGASGILRWFAAATLLHILYFGLASLCAALTGNVFILPVVYAVLLYAAVALESSLRTIAQYLVFGLTGSSWKLTALSPAYHLRVSQYLLIQTDWAETVYNETTGPHMAALVRFDAWPLLIGYAAAGLVFAVLAAVLIRRRPMESAGETVAVPFLKKLFPWCAALAGALTLGLLALKSVFGFTGYLAPTGSLPRVLTLLVCMLLGAFLGWFGAHGLLRRSLRVFDRGWKGFGIVCAVIAALVLGTEFDLWGVERAVPDADEVAFVRIWDTYASSGETVFSQPENIEAAIRLQEKIVENKTVFESAVPANSTDYYPYSALEITYVGRDGGVLLSRRYVAPNGPMCWASNGDFYGTYASDGDAYEAYASPGSPWASGGSAAPWGSANPALQDLQDLLNTPEGIEQRVRPAGVEPKPSTVVYGGAWRSDGYMNMEEITLDRAEAWEIYASCILPDAADGNIGLVRLCPAEKTGRYGERIYLWINFSSGYGNDSVDGYVSLNVTERAERTSAWLEEHGITVPWLERAYIPEEEPPAETTYDVEPLEGLAALLENLRTEYSAEDAGTVVSARWARSMLEWYSGVGEDPFRVYDDARNYGFAYGSGGEEMIGKLERLRAAGLQAVSGSAVLVRDRGAWENWDMDTVDLFFDAVRAGLAAAASYGF